MGLDGRLVGLGANGRSFEGANEVERPGNGEVAGFVSAKFRVESGM